MPAARPTKAAISNAIMAVVSAGLTPGAIQINNDGSFRVEIVTASELQSCAPSAIANNDGPLTWEEAA